jgi:signal peptidase II
MHKMLRFFQKNKFSFESYAFILFFSLFLILDIFIDNKIRSTSGFYICNKGISFGFNINIYYILLFFCLILALFYLFILKKIIRESFLNFLAIFMVISGSFSNIYDRLRYGCVLDYIHTHFLYFPLFNLSDIFIFIGATILIHRLSTK